MIPRESHERVSEAHKRGIGNYKACVACTINRDGLSIAKTSNVVRLSVKDLSKVFSESTEKDSLFISDSFVNYSKEELFEKKNTFEVCFKQGYPCKST